MQGNAKGIRQAIRVLVDEGYFRREQGPRKSWEHYSVMRYRQTEDNAGHEPARHPVPHPVPHPRPSPRPWATWWTPVDPVPPPGPPL